MKHTDFKTKNQKELQELLRELQGKLLQLRFDHADKKLKDFSQLGKTKRTIARVLTLLRDTTK